MSEPTVPLALLAGVLSFLSPCMLPLLPSYLGVIGHRPAQVLPRALGFVAGFSTVFVVLGAAASTLGALLRTQMVWLVPASGVLIMAFGLFMLGLVKVPALLGEYRPSLTRASRYGPVALGAAFAFGWTACIGPLLGSILTVAATGGQLRSGVGLLLAYALGLAAPYLGCALLWNRLSVRALLRHSPTFERLGGALLLLFGLLVFTGEAPRLTGALLSVWPWR